MYGHDILMPAFDAHNDTEIVNRIEGVDLVGEENQSFYYNLLAFHSVANLC